MSLEVEELARSSQNNKRDQDMKLENMLSKESMGLKFPSATGSSIGRLLS
jgi:hypothetical protein